MANVTLFWLIGVFSAALAFFSVFQPLNVCVLSTCTILQSAFFVCMASKPHSLLFISFQSQRIFGRIVDSSCQAEDVDAAAFGHFLPILHTLTKS